MGCISKGLIPLINAMIELHLMGNRDICGVSGVFWVVVGGGRGGVNLDVSADRDSQARVIFFAGG